MNQNQIRDLAVGALDAACKHIQDAMGVTTGDNAAMFFSGASGEAVERILRAYISSEIMEESDQRSITYARNMCEESQIWTDWKQSNYYKSELAGRSR